MKKRLFSLALALALCLGLTAIPASAAENTFYPKTGAELEALLEAGIPSSTTIILEGKEYQVEYGCSLERVENVTIRGTAGTRITCDSGSDTVLFIDSSKNVVLENLTLGHNEYLTWENAGGCTAGVVNADGSSVIFRNCDLFGYGLFGLYASDSNITMESSTVRDCSEFALELFDTTGLFQSCTFSGNGYDEDCYDYGFSVGASDDGTASVVFNACTFLNNQNPQFLEAEVYGYTDNGDPARQIKVTLKGCTFRGNGWGEGTPSGTCITSSSSAAAQPTTSTVLVNGKQVAFDAYNIDGSNYFKLRDLAYVLNGSEKQFNVVWSASANAISLVSGKPYAAAGGELAPGSGTIQEALPTTSALLLDGADLALEAYNINGNNYFKLRDLGSALNFGVDWDGAANTVVIDTAKGYTP